MPTALILVLRPTSTTPIAPHLGRASHAALLRAIGERNAALSQRLHDATSIKPFAASDLLGVPPGRSRSVSVERTYRLRWCGLTDEIDALLGDIAAAPPPSIELDSLRYTVEYATVDPQRDPLANVVTWHDLLASDDASSPPVRFRLRFLAPTTFRSSGRNTPLPLPELVIGSLLDRWNCAAPTALPGDLRRFAADHLLIGRYDLRSLWIAVFNAGETAFTGFCTYRATRSEQPYLQFCGALMRLAEFSGVGAKASMGFGLVRYEAWQPETISERSPSAP